MQAVDFYKLGHQACFGAEHAIPSQAHAAAWLEREITRLEKEDQQNANHLPREPLIDPIRRDGRIVRIHLRPFIRRSGDRESLLHAFVHSANKIESSIKPHHTSDPAIKREEFEDYWRELLRCLEKASCTKDRNQEIPLNQARVFGSTMAGKGYPAVHHSDAFRSHYSPAYRVIAAPLIPLALRGISSADREGLET